MTLHTHLQFDQETDIARRVGGVGLRYHDNLPDNRWAVFGAESESQTIGRCAMNRVIAKLAGAGAAVALALASTGCSDDREDTAARSPSVPARSASADNATLPADWQRFTSEQHSVSFGTPDGWIHVEPGTEEFDRGIEALGLADSEAVQAVVDQAAANGDYYFVFDTNSISNTGTPFATNINVYCFDSQSTNSIERLETVLQTAMEQISAENLQTEVATIGSREALRMTYDLPTPNVQIGGTQYHWLAGDDRACSFTLSTDRPDDYAQLFEQIAATVQIG